MSKKGLIGKLLLGGAVLGAAAATTYTYIKKYKELIPEEPEFDPDTAVDGEVVKSRSYSKIDMAIAKEAAKATFVSIKDGGKKAWKTASDSAKAVSDVVMDNYGDSIHNAKAKVTDAYNTAKDFTVEKAGALKERLGDVTESVKDKFTEKGANARDFVSEKAEAVKERFETFKSENPQFEESVQEAKETACRAYESVKDKISEFCTETSNDFEVTPDDKKEE